MATMKEYREDVSGQAYLHTHTASATSPLLQAVFTGALVSIPIMMLMIKYRVQDWLMNGVIIFFVITSGVWIYSLRHWFKLTKIERMTGIDLNRDGVVGDPVREVVRPVRVDVNEYENGKHVRTTRAHYENEARMIALADALINHNIPFSYDALCIQRKILKRSELKAIREEMEKRGMAYQVNPESVNSPWELTNPGRAALKELLLPHSPTR
jgi:hypothetical protein